MNISSCKCYEYEQPLDGSICESRQLACSEKCKDQVRTRVLIIQYSYTFRALKEASASPNSTLGNNCAPPVNASKNFRS